MARCSLPSAIQFAAFALLRVFSEERLAKADTGYSVSEIIAPWKTRENAWQSLQIEWTEAVFHPAGSMFLSPAARRAAATAGEMVPSVPEKDIQLHLSATVLISEDCVRLDRDEHVWDGERSAFHVCRESRVWSAEVDWGSTVWSKDGPGQSSGRVFMNGDSRKGPTVTYRELPVLFAARPTSRIVKRFEDQTRWTLSPNWFTAGNVKWLVLERRSERFGLEPEKMRVRIFVYIDPVLDYHISRYELYQGDNLISTFNINYNEHEQLGWVPDTWKGIIMQYRDGEPSLHQQFEGKVTKISTDYIPPEVFEPKFPEGVIVTDHRTDTKWLVGRDGERLPLPPAPEQLAQIAADRTQNLIFVCTLLAIIAFVFTFVTWRALRRARVAA
jgi:hypothetical protein